jgi:hypothetical protein
MVQVRPFPADIVKTPVHLIPQTKQEGPQNMLAAFIHYDSTFWCARQSLADLVS